MKKSYLILIMAMLLIGIANAIVVETGSFRNFLYGVEPACEYDNWMSHIAEGLASPGYNHYAPYDRQTNGFGNFRTITISETNAWKSVIDYMLLENYVSAETAIQNGNFPYQVVEFHDTDTGRTYYLLRENLNMNYHDDNGTPDDPSDDEIGAFAYAWGLYLFNPQGSRPIILTAPHPCDDFPTPATTVLALEELDPRFMMISGAGREAKWTQVDSYTNAKSLSDPTRVAAHPFNYAYDKMADYIRDEYGLREFSLQVHSYDYDLHLGYPNNQISAGNQKWCPNLPIRDLSDARNDMINQAPEYIHPANAVGTHAPVHITDFYGVYYNIHDFTWSDGVNEFPVNDKIDLPAYSQNHQMLYTLSGWNDYDTYDPFFHIEMDELPECYEQTVNNFNWFYGWDEATQSWDLQNRYTRFLEFYSPWVHHLKAVLDDTFQMDNGEPPTNIQNFSIVSPGLNNVTLSWQKSSDFDFYSYEILYATEPIAQDNYMVYSRDNNSILASQACESIAIPGLNNSYTYYFKIRAKDKNGNYSVLSNEVSTDLAPAAISNFVANGMDHSIRVAWSVSSQSGNQGFKIYRKSQDEDYIEVDSWQTNPSLAARVGNFEWWDLDLAYSDIYTYKVSCTNNADVEYIHNFPASAHAMPVHYIGIRNAAGNLTDSISFGNNYFASDDKDNYWDATKSNPSGNYVWNAFWQPNWGNQGTSLASEVKAGYDVDSEMKTWTMRTRSNQTGNLTIEASDTFGRSEKLWLLDGGTYHNLLESPYTFSNSNSNVRTFTLFWGNMLPKVTAVTIPNQVLQGGDNITFSWNYTYPFLVDHMELSLQNEADSLNISNSISSSQNNIEYIIPQRLDLPKAKLVMDLYAVDGVHTRFSSDYTLAFVPFMNLKMFEPGWQTMVNPWPQNPLTVAEVFGDGSLAYAMDQNDAWIPQEDFHFANPIWANPVDTSFYSTTSDVQNGEYFIDLEDGWNLIGNPHLCEYELVNLRFNVNGKVYSFGDMVAQELISPAIYVFKEGRYHLTKVIKPFEAFLIRYYASPLVFSQVDFLPYWEAYDTTPPLAQSSIDLFAQTQDGADWIRVGTHDYVNTELSFKLNLPKAPEPPFAMPRFTVIDPIPSLRPDQEYQSFFKNPLDDGQNFEQEINFSLVLELPTTDPVTFSWGDNTLPQQWQVAFYIDNMVYHDGSLNELIFVPQEAGTYQCSIRLSNYIVSNDNPIAALISKPLAYPNPFNPNVNIAFSLNKSSPVSVDVYNVKGQKVRNLQNGTMNQGQHSLTWNGKDGNGKEVASGIYMVRILSGKSSQAIKVMMMK